MEYRLDERLRLFGAFGFSRLTVSGVAPARTGPSWRTGLRGDFDGWSGEATYSRSFVPSYGFGGTQQNEELTGRVHVPLSRAMYAESSLGWRINEPLTVGGLKLHSLSVQGVFGYAFARWARIEAFYDQGSQNIDRPGGAVRRHRIGGQILTTKPMRIR
jgi:hypothetical protein